MRMFLKRSLVLFLAVIILIPILWNQDVTVASAATPTLLNSNVEMIGVGETYQLEFKNKVKNSTYKWYSYDKKVAKVSKKGLITSVAPGTTKIKCRITYPSKKSKVIYCKVTVTIPATGIDITQDTLENNCYKIVVGSSFDFNSVMTPANSTDSAYWHIDEAASMNPDCITLDNNNQGIVTGVKPGFAVLHVKASKNATDESDIDDSINIEVVPLEAKVIKADITGTNEITIVFDSPIQKNTVITSGNTLSSNIGIALRKNTKQILANDPGALTASLSTDLKTLTITTANILSGDYSIHVSNSVLTTGGVAITESTEYITYSDTVGPSIKNVALDETGMIATINFTEAVDFSNFKVSDVKVASGSCDANSLAVLKNTLNYVPSTDKKSLTINLSTMAQTDYGKVFSVVFSGIKDLAGNIPSTYTLTELLYTDTTQKLQARPNFVMRTGYYTLSAYFDRAIKTPGSIQLSDGNIILGIVDPKNTKKVDYTIPSSYASLTGVNTVNIFGWNSYNVMPSDTYATMPHPFSVDFTVDSTSPTLVSYTYDAATNILALTYNEKVELIATSGNIDSRLVTVTDEIKAKTNISYAQVSDTEDNIVYIKMSNVSVSGTYSFNLEAGFVIDNFRNKSASSAINIDNRTSTSSELPGPSAITQTGNEIYIYFANKLDKVSAETLVNYSIPGVVITSVMLYDNTSSGGTVLLTVADGTINASLDWPIYISGVKGYNNSFAAITSYKGFVLLKENVKPTLVSTTFDSSTKKAIKLTFSEQITGNLTVTVKQNFGGSSTDITNTVTISGNVATINLNTIPISGSYLLITVVDNTITDLNGNKLTTLTSTGLIAN